jgi:hypothetical protein
MEIAWEFSGNKRIPDLIVESTTRSIMRIDSDPTLKEREDAVHRCVCVRKIDDYYGITFYATDTNQINGGALISLGTLLDQLLEEYATEAVTTCEGEIQRVFWDASKGMWIGRGWTYEGSLANAS